MAAEDVIEASNNPNFRGRQFAIDNKAVLDHIVCRSFRDHLGRSALPNMKFRLGEFVKMSNDGRCKAKDNGPGETWNTDVYCDYKIEDRTLGSDYFCIDNICFEMFPNTCSKYGVSWMNIYLSEAGFEQFIQKFKGDIDENRYRLDESEYTIDKRQKLVSICVSMDEIDLPSFKMTINDVINYNHLNITDCGTFDNVLHDPQMHGLYRGTGIFSCNYKVELDKGCIDHPNDCYYSFHGRLRMQLIGVRIFGKEEKLRKVGSKGIRGL